MLTSTDKPIKSITQILQGFATCYHRS